MTLTMTYPLNARNTATTTTPAATTTTTAATTAAEATTTTTTVAAAPLLTDVEIEVWWSSLTALGHLLTDCVPAKAIVDSSIGLRVLVRALLPLTRSLATSGSGGGGGGGGSSSSGTPLVGCTSTSSSSTTSSTTSSTNMAHPYINLPSETVPSRPTIISTLLLGTTTTPTTTNQPTITNHYDKSNNNKNTHTPFLCYYHSRI